MTIWEGYANHSFGRELQAISQRLQRHPRIHQWAAFDLIDENTKDTGRKGMTVDSIIRAAIIKQAMNLSYERLAFEIEDSQSVRAFTRIDRRVSAAALQAVISRIKATTWEKINRALLGSAQQDGLELGRQTRTDATVMETNIHEPSDSTLLEDAQRTMVRFLRWGREEMGLDLAWVNHGRICRKLVRQIQGSSRKVSKPKNYKRLLEYVRFTRCCLSSMQTQMVRQPKTRTWHQEVEALLPLVDGVTEQTQKRVLEGQSVPASEKIVSLFEPHTDIIVKGKRKVQFGHKLNLTTGTSGLVIDLVVHQGNPPDSSTVKTMIERQTQVYGIPPRQISFDGGYASKANLEEAKALGVKDVAFHKRRGLKVSAMTKSEWVYRKLINFRAGIEGNISALKRRYGWYRCSWKGWEGFQSYAWASVVAYNLITMARMSMGPAP